MNTVTPTPAQRLSGPLCLISAAHPLCSKDTPHLIPVDDRFPDIRMERRSAVLLSACLQKVDGQGRIVPVSGWRSQAEQQAIWDETLHKEGASFTRQYVAVPGCSEHQSGFAMDLGLSDGAPLDLIRPAFPPEGVCAAFQREAPHYGFILRYGAGKEHITGIAHEPWHFRYVGIPHAELMTTLDLTLEEYLSLLRQFHSDGTPLHFHSGPYRFRIFYLPPACASFSLPEDTDHYLTSGDNCGGLVITTWRKKEAAACR